MTVGPLRRQVAPRSPPPLWAFRGFPALSPVGPNSVRWAPRPEFCAVADGTFDAFSVVGNSTLFGWDYLAGMLVCNEVGAVTLERDGADVRVRGRTSTAARGCDPGVSSGPFGRRRSMSTDEEALLARQTWRTLEPLHAMIYFVPEAAAAYERIGITGRSGYFASRAAPMGPVVPEVVIATFFNFNPELVDTAIPKAWEIAAPEEIVATRLRPSTVRFDALGSDVVSSREMSRAAELARALAESVGAHEGRPLVRPMRPGLARRRTRCSGMRSRSCANSGAMVMSRSCSCTGCRELKR